MKANIKNTESVILTHCQEGESNYFIPYLRAGGDKIIGVTVENGSPKLLVDEGNVVVSMSLNSGWPTSLKRAIIDLYIAN
jgi:hypothetical protein